MTPESNRHMLSGPALFSLTVQIIIQTEAAIWARIHALMLALNGTSSSIHSGDFPPDADIFLLWRNLKNSSDTAETVQPARAWERGRAGDAPCINVHCKRSLRFSGLWLCDRFHNKKNWLNLMLPLCASGILTQQSVLTMIVLVWSIM